MSDLALHRFLRVSIPPGTSDYIADSIRSQRLLAQQYEVLKAAARAAGVSVEDLRRLQVIKAAGIECSPEELLRQREERKSAVWNTQEWRDAHAEGMRSKTPEEQRAYDERHAAKRRELAWRGGARRRARLREATIELVDRRAIIERDSRTCYLCGVNELSDEQIHLDHVIPLARGGAHSPENLRVACADCNMRKGARTADEYLPSARITR